jgi:hypothetical protein
MRRLRFNRWGLTEDPRGYFVRYPKGDGFALREVTEVYRREFPPAVMLKVRSFNREIVEDVAAGYVEVIE